MSVLINLKSVKKRKRGEDKKEWLVFLRPSKKTTKGVYVVLFLPINNSPPP